MMLPTDVSIGGVHNSDCALLTTVGNEKMALMEDPEFKKWVLLYAKDQKKFFEDFALAFGKLIELGVNRDDSGFSRLVNKAAREGKPLDKVGGGCPFASAIKQGKTELDKNPRESKL